MNAAALAPTLSTAAFEASVAELKPHIAVFDCDGTLWSGDAGSSFMHWTIETGLVSSEAAAWIHDRYRLYNAGEVDELAICGEMVQMYQSLREADLREASAEFFSTRIEPHIFPELERVIASLHHRNTEIWAVSSTNNWVIEHGVRRFGIPPERVLAARVEVVDGVVSDRILAVPTDQGKVDVLVRAGLPHPDAVFGNSVHDAAMLAIARRAFPVNPTPALVERSAREGWPVFYPETVRPAA